MPKFFLPKDFQDYIPENHVARMVSRIIDSIDISDIVASYDYQGAPPYHLRMMLKVSVYAYIVWIRCSRKIDSLLHDSLVFIIWRGDKHQILEHYAGSEGNIIFNSLYSLSTYRDLLNIRTATIGLYICKNPFAILLHKYGT
jgi:hypothetical protein